MYASLKQQTLKTLAKNKIRQWAELNGYPHVVQSTEGELLHTDHVMKGKWHPEFFKNNNPIILELGCGKGEYTVGLAKRYPEKNFIGVDIKGHRMWDGAKTVFDQKILNAGFLRTRMEFIVSFFAEHEVEEIWLTFSDPEPLKPQKRLSSPQYIDRYKKFLKPGGTIHLKTDSAILYDSTLEMAKENNYKILFSSNDLYGKAISEIDSTTQEILSIRTHYEKIFMNKGKTIKYLKFIPA